tara:strand:- start:573 stop:941 length:369 start_codon:yes stop_codon:yes gene_type:complete
MSESAIFNNFVEVSGNIDISGNLNCSKKLSSSSTFIIKNYTINNPASSTDSKPLALTVSDGNILSWENISSTTSSSSSGTSSNFFDNITTTASTSLSSSSNTFYSRLYDSLAANDSNFTYNS